MADNDEFDDILTTIGFGRWQVPSIMATIFIVAQLPVHQIGSNFLNAPLAFRCSPVPPVIDQNSTYYLRSDSNNTYYDSTCFSFDNPSAVLSTSGVKAGNATGTGLASCPYIEYDTSVFTSTVVSQWHIVCEQSGFLPLFQMTYNAGGLVGSCFGGYIGDRYGRKRAILTGGIVSLIAVSLMSCVPLYSLVLVMRFLLGCTHSVTLLPAWGLALETAPSKHRSLVGMLLGLPYSLGVITFAGIGYLVRNWQYLLLTSPIPIAIIVLLFAIYLDESPSWLIQQERIDDAVSVLRNAMKKNNAKLNTPLVTIVTKLAKNGVSSREETVEGSENPAPLVAKMREILKYFRSPAMRIILLLTPVLWILQSFLYLSIAINANNFTSTDPFLYVALSGTMDGSAILLTTPLATRFGRKILIFSGMFLGAVLFLLDLLVPLEYFWAKWVLVMSGFLMVGGSYQVNYMYGPELFPTEARTRGFALLNVYSNIGNLLAPLVTSFAVRYTWWAGGVFFGCAGILGSSVVPFLPETRNKPLPETLQDVEDRRNTAIKRKKDNERGLQDVEGKEEEEGKL